MTSLFLTDIDFGILRGLASFRYMSVAQFIRAEIARDTKHLRERLARLLNAKLIARTDKAFDRAQNIGVPCLHYLTQKGADLLNEDDRFNVKAPSRRMTAFDDIPHRVGVVDVHLAFDQWARATDTEVHGVWRYFEGAAREADQPPKQATAFTWESWDDGTEFGEAGKLVPDLMALFQRRNDTEARGVIFEYERGGRSGTPNHFLAKVMHYHDAISAGAAEKHLKIRTGVYIAVVFSTQKMLDEVIRKWPDSKSPIWKNRVFLKARTLDGSFAKGWVTPEGNMTNLFSINP